MSTSAPSLIKDFKRLIEGDRLGHAYLLFGESPKRLHNAGVDILRSLVTSDGGKDDGSIIPDGLIVSKDENGAIGIDAVRSLISFLWQKPILSARRSVFIDGADALTQQAENALLKTIEEPPPHGLIIASTLRPESLAAPLASRFQKIFVSGSAQLTASGSVGEEISGENLARAQKFVVGTAQIKREVIAEVLALESDPALREFVTALLIECRKDPVKNFALMSGVTDRWAKISQFNVNKKLQLETWLL